MPIYLVSEFGFRLEKVSRAPDLVVPTNPDYCQNFNLVYFIILFSFLGKVSPLRTLTACVRLTRRRCCVPCARKSPTTTTCTTAPCVVSAVELFSGEQIKSVIFSIYNYYLIWKQRGTEVIIIELLFDLLDEFHDAEPLNLDTIGEGRRGEGQGESVVIW